MGQKDFYTGRNIWSKIMNNYTQKELVQLAKRDNNTKRPYLLVDPLQGKHIPVSPKRSISLFQNLAKKIYSSYPGEKLLIIGFAETATAIGAAIACASPVDIYYIHTTRECIDNVEYLYFSESHSHATEQKIVKEQLSEMIEKSDRIVFAEDEVTTGNTILNICQVLRQEFSNKVLKFGIASILNGMTDEQLSTFRNQGILCTYLLKIEIGDYDTLLKQYNFNSDQVFQLSGSNTIENECQLIYGRADSRRGCLKSVYIEKCEAFTRQILETVDVKSITGKRILVLGTEEFMYPALHFAAKLESDLQCAEVCFHATTRSPILPCCDDDYPLFSRYELKSLYDSNRTTFIYNIKEYDKVFVLHDAQADFLPGLKTLTTALRFKNCNDIQAFCWSN